MTTEYLSKESALLAGIAFAGRHEKLKPEDLKLVAGKISQFGNVNEESELFEFEARNGELALIGVGPFRGKYWELWLFDHKTGMGHRT